MMEYSKINVSNMMELSFSAYSVNEALARVCVSAFVAFKNPTLEEISDIKTAVSEAVTNCVIHGYAHDSYMPEIEDMEEHEDERIYLRCRLDDNLLTVEIEDKGIGIDNIEQAMEPMFTTKPDMERSGMGFAFMEAFMDDLEVISTPGEGTLIRMKKEIGSSPWIYEE